MTSMTFDNTEKRIRALLVKDFKLDPGTLTHDARLEDLGVDSIGMAELIFNVEDEFGLKLPDVAVQLTTFGEVVQFIDEAVSVQRPTSALFAVAQGAPTAT
jgi:acyl carrier protein